MSQDQSRSTQPTKRFEDVDEDESAGLLPGTGAEPKPGDDDFVVEAGAFGSGQVIDGRPLGESSAGVLAETGSSEDLTIDRDAMTITDHRAELVAPDPNDRTRAEGTERTKQLGSFDLERKVGQGGMGEVWLARQRSLDRLVAVKVLPRSLASQESFLERFQREARAAASLKHPHVIQVYEFGIEDGTPYFAMEYVEGEDLQQVMRRERYVNLREAVEVVRDVASALEAAHAKGIIHRDIKPSNVMIDRDGIVKVMDFGLAKATASDDANLTNAGLIMGTPNYLSPEQGRGDPLDSRSDLYSLGVVFYELLAGKLPFRADTPAGLIFKHVYEPPPDLLEQRPDLPPFLVDVCNRLLCKDRDERYPNAAEVLADLDEFLDNAPHYMDGGERRPGSGSDNPLRVASGRAQAIRRAARRRASESDRSKAGSGVRESITEEIEASSVEELIDSGDSEVVIADSDPDLDAAETLPPGRALDESSGTYPTPDELPRALHSGEELRERVRAETRRESRPGADGGGRTKLWIALAALVLIGLGLRFGAPDATAGFFHRQLPGLAAPLSSVGVLAEDPRAHPLKPTQLVFDTPDLSALPEGTKVTLVVGEKDLSLTPGERNALAPGSYLLRFARTGYRMDQTVELVAIASSDPNSGKLSGENGADPWRQDLSWTPTSELLEGYRQGKALLDAGRAEDAIEPLTIAEALDPEFSDGGGPTAAELLAKARSGAETPDPDATTDPPTPNGDFDPNDPESVRKTVERLWTSANARNWREVLKRLEALPGLESADGDALVRLRTAASNGIDAANTQADVFTQALEEGDLGSAGEAWQRLKVLDPQRPDLTELGERLSRTRKRRELAFSTTVPDFEERQRNLQSYLELAPHDADAKTRLREVNQELQRLAELRALEGELQALTEEGSWAEAAAKAEELTLRDEGNPVAAKLGAQARLELDRTAILERVTELDATLRDDPDAVAALLPNPVERRAWKDFLAFSGKFTASTHEVDRTAISVTGDLAVLEGVWSFEIAVLDQPAQAVRKPQRITLRRADQGWTFDSFEVLE